MATSESRKAILSEVGHDAVRKRSDCPKRDGPVCATPLRSSTASLLHGENAMTSPTHTPDGPIVTDEEREKGRRKAEGDIAAGLWEIHHSHDNYDTSLAAAEIVRRRHGLEGRLQLSFHDVIVPKTLLQHARASGYNDRIREEFIARFCRDVWEEDRVRRGGAPPHVRAASLRAGRPRWYRRPDVYQAS